MWVNVKSLVATGPYSEAGMLLWTRRCCGPAPAIRTCRVYDWAAAAKDSWFISDGIHYTSAGYAARAYLIARALAAAFPDQRTAPPNCLVR